MKNYDVFVFVALALTAAVCAQDDCEDDYPPSPDLVPRVPGSTPPTDSRFGFTDAFLGQACVGQVSTECGNELYCETTTQACQRSLPLGAECDPSLLITSCSNAPPSVCVTQANGRGKCVNRVFPGFSCADPAAGGCIERFLMPPVDLCSAGICTERTIIDGRSVPGLLKACASDTDCFGTGVCRAALDGRKRCLRESGVGGNCGAYDGRIPTFSCAAGTACDGRTQKCLNEGVTAAIGEKCSEAGPFNHLHFAVCDSSDSSTQAICPIVYGENNQVLPSQCELDLTGKRCGSDGDCVSGGVEVYKCDFGVCARFPFGDRIPGSKHGHLSSCGSDVLCTITFGNGGSPTDRCTLADDGTNRCLQERQIGASCAAVGGLVRDFFCAQGTRCHGPSQTCVRDVPAVGVGQPCGTTAGVQFVACVDGTSCGSQVNRDGFRLCV